MRSVFRPIPLLFLLLLPGLAACAAGGTGTGSGETTGVRRASNRISAEELATVAELDLQTAINRLRPSWLRQGTRGSSPQVILDGSPQQGGVGVLASIRVSDVTALEFMSASDATTRFGTGYTSGAIVVTLRR